MISVASLLSISCFLSSPYIIGAQLPTGKILWLTDIHLDISPDNVGDRFGRFGHDTNVPLWAATIRSIRTTLPNPDFIFVTGDSVTGNLRNITSEGVFVNPVDTLRAVTVALDSFRGARCFFTLGPNDVIENINRKHVYSALAQMWRPWIGDDAQTLAQYGYYSAKLGKNIFLVSLNTNLFLEQMTDFSDVAAQNQISWLRRVLDSVRRARGAAIIIGHTPPGIDEVGRMRWSYNFQEQFIDLVEEQSGIIRMMLFGSTHSDTFQLVSQRKRKNEGRFAKSARPDTSKQGNVILMAPSVAPWMNPNYSPSSPAFRILDYAIPTGELMNVHQYYMDLSLSNQLDQPIWSRLYSLGSLYGIRPINGEAMLDVYNRLSKSDQMMSEYIDRQGAINTTKSCDSICRRHILCSIKYMRLVEWMQCVQPYDDADTPSTTSYLPTRAWVPIVAGAILLLFVVSLFVYFGAKTVRGWCGYKRFA